MAGFQAHARLLAGVVAVLVLLSGCAGTPQTGALLDQPPESLPPVTELHGTPFFAQQRYQCGPAALATVLAAHSVAVTPDELKDSVYIPELQGSLPEEITASARRHGMLVYPLAPSLADLLQEVAAGYPVLVMQNLGTQALPRLHFAVVVGYGLGKQHIILRSGTVRRRLTPLGVFEQTWARTGHRAWVIVPPGEIPATASVDGFLRAMLDLESAGHAAAARRAGAAAIVRWPAHPHAWMAQGNLLYAAAQYPEAAIAFEHAVNLETDNPQGWNNLAYALAASGCAAQAAHAVRQAVALAPSDPAYRRSQADIAAQSTALVPASCPASTTLPELSNP